MGVSSQKWKNWTPPLNSAYSNFILNWPFWFFGPNLPKKDYFRSKTERVNIIIGFCIFELVLVLNLNLNWKFWFFCIKIYPKSLFPVENWESELHHWILHIWISVGTKFQLKQAILIFRTKFDQKGYFWSKLEKLNTTIEFCIFKLVLVLLLVLL